jgi:hypothetical protein
MKAERQENVDLLSAELGKEREKVDCISAFAIYNLVIVRNNGDRHGRGGREIMACRFLFRRFIIFSFFPSQSFGLLDAMINVMRSDVLFFFF